MEWKNKIALITGGTTGIGKATKELLRQKGCIAYSFDCNNPPEDDPRFIKGNVSNKDEVNQAVDFIVNNEGRLDFLFANAGVHLFATLEETSYEQLESIVGINVLGVYYLLKKVIPVMKKQRKGSVVLMGSDQVFVGKASSSVYGMTKGAIGQLTKSTAIDYARFNIRVNCICPGTVDTPLLDKAVAHFSEKTGTPAKDVYTSLDGVQPMGRIGKPEEIAESVAFLLSDESSFTTGSLFAVDGGYTCQ